MKPPKERVKSLQCICQHLVQKKQEAGNIIWTFFSVFDQNKPHRVEERGKVTLHVLQFQPIEKQLISKNF